MNADKEKIIVNHVARSARELEDAYSLVHREYKTIGLVRKSYKKSRLRISIFNANPDTTTFVAKYRSRVIATVTVIPDSPLGLPMDKIYKKEMDVLRRKKLKLVEVGQFATDTSLFPKGWFSLFNFNKLIFILRLFKVVLDYLTYEAGVDEICINMVPGHERLYDLLMFENLVKKPRRYSSVNNRVVIAKHLTIGTIENRARRVKKGLYTIFFGKKTLADAFRGKYTLTKKDLEHFFVKRANIFERATPERVAFIKKCYPAGMVDDILNRYGIRN